MRGSFWTIFTFGTQQGMRFVGNVALTRLLVPEYFGIMAVVSSLIMGLGLFSDIGIKQNIVQSRNAYEPNFLNTAWTLQIIRSIIIFLVICLAAIPMAKYYEEPVLAPLIVFSSASFLLSGFDSTKIVIFERELKLGWKTAIDLTANVLGLTSMVLWALVSPSVWALPIGGIISTSFKVFASHAFLPGVKNRLCWDKKYVKEIVSFGKWILLASVTMFLSEQSDRFILAKLLSFSLLGIYTVALALAQLPQQIIKRLNSQVFFPLVTQNAHLPRAQLSSKILAKRRIVLLSFAAFIAFSASFGDLLIDFLYDERYIDAAWMFSILCLGVWFTVLFYTSVSSLLGIGKPFYTAQGNVARLIMMVGGIPLAFSWWGTLGAISAIALSDLPGYLVIQRGMFKERLFFYRQDILTSCFFVGLAALFLGSRYLAGFVTPFDLLLAGS